MTRIIIDCKNGRKNKVHIVTEGNYEITKFNFTSDYADKKWHTKEDITVTPKERK